MNREVSGLMFSYIQKSAYHDSCIPKDRQQAAPPTDKKYSESDYSKCDNVTQDTIWKQSVGKEKMCLKNWEENWGFLTEFDEKGNQRPPEELPEKVDLFSGNVPCTNSGNYGARVNTDVGQTMQKLEFNFFGKQRRKKLGNDLVCY